jgi:MFS family permease
VSVDSQAIRRPFDYGWVNVALGALAMTATLPGRTHGLGLITNSLIEDLGIKEQEFSELNFWAIMLGALLAWPIGWLIDRWGTRAVGGGVVLALGAAVIAMSRIEANWLFPCLLLVRGLGQGALSIVSLAIVGKWFDRRVGPAMGVYSVLLAIGFIVATLLTGQAVQVLGWRVAWFQLGLTIVALAPLILLFVRSMPRDIDATGDVSPNDATLGQALCSPAFWIYSLSSALFGLVWSSVTLFGESILQEHQFGADTFLLVMAILSGFGLVCNLVGGWLAMTWPMGRLLGIGMLLLAVALGAFPWIETQAGVIGYALILGGSGGLITVVFFAFYRQAFGASQLGRIQGSAHILTVFASALGPVLLTWCRRETGNSDGLFLTSACLVAMLGIIGWRVRLPREFIPSPTTPE